MKSLKFKTVKFTTFLALLFVILFNAVDVEAQSFVRKRYRFNLGVEGSKLGFGLSAGFNMNEYITWGVTYVLIDEKSAEIKKSGNLAYLSLDYYPFDSNNIYFGYAYGDTNVKWTLKYCENFVENTNCKNIEIKWPRPSHQLRFGYKSFENRSRVTATFQLYYTMFQKPELTGDNDTESKVLKSRYEDEVNVSTSQFGIMVGLGYLF